MTREDGLLPGQMCGKRGHHKVWAEVNVDDFILLAPKEAKISDQGAGVKLRLDPDWQVARNPLGERRICRTSDITLDSRLGQALMKVDDVSLDTTPIDQRATDLKDFHLFPRPGRRSGISVLEVRVEPGLIVGHHFWVPVVPPVVGDQFLWTGQGFVDGPYSIGLAGWIL